MKILFLSLLLISLWHPIAQAATGTVVVWGYYAGGVTNVPPGLTNIVSVAAGLDHAVALRNDGTVVAWGSDSGYGETHVPPGLSNVVSVSAGWLFSMALRSDGTVMTWGNDATVPPPGLTNVVAISAGGHQFCLALRSDKTVVAWGYNGSGQTNVPSDLTNVVSVAGGLDHSAALRSDGTVAVWGGSEFFQETNLPPGLSNVVAISAGWSQTLALRADGTVAGWGYDASVPADLSSVVAVAAGWDAGQEFLKHDGSVVYGSTGLSNVVSLARGHLFGIAVSVSSDPAATLAMPLAAPQWSAGRFGASALTRCGRVYALEYKDSMTAGNWTALPLAAGNGEVQTIHDDNASASQRFYRLIKW